jgi:chemotaxis protein MotB
MHPRRRASDHGEFHPDERWLITYADMITLLLALFVVLYALSDTNLRKFNEFAQSVSAAFSTDVFQGTRAITVTSGFDSAPDVGSIDSGSGVLDADRRTVEATIKDYAVQEGLGGQISVDQVPEGIAIRISDTLLFPSGRARLDARSAALLEKIIGVVQPLPNRLRVEGHTDDERPSGPFYTDNWRLSIDRATAVLEAMAAGGIEPSRLAAAGYGEYRPLVPNADEPSRARNRRVDVLILYPNDPLQPLFPSAAPAGGPS